MLLPVYLGVCLYEDEGQTLRQANLKDGSVLCIEKGGKAVPNSLHLRIALVTGNDPATKSNPKVPGVRDTIVECDVLGSMTVTALRDLAGSLLLALTPGWTVPPPSPPVPTPLAPPEDPNTDPFHTVPTRKGRDGRVHAPAPTPPVVPSTSHGSRSNGHGRNATRSSHTSHATPPQPLQNVKYDLIQGLLPMKSSTPSVPSDHTSTSSSSSTKDTINIECPEKRLRRTNAFEECGDLLDEIEALPNTQNWRGRRVQGQGQGQGHHDITQTSTGHPKILPHPQQDGWKESDAAVVENIHITLDTAGIRSGDLLLFEDGPVLQRGIVKLSVYLWLKNLESLLTPATSAHESATATATAATASSEGDVTATAATGKISSGHRQGQGQGHGQGQGQGQGHGQSGRGSERGGGRSRRRDSNGRDGRRSRGEGGSTSGDGTPVQAAAQSVRTSSEKLSGTKSDAKIDVKSDASGQASTTTSLEMVEKEVVKEEVAVLNAFVTAVKERSKHLLPLFVAVPISLAEESSLLQLQKAVWTGLHGEAVALALKGVLPSWKGECLSSLFYMWIIFYF